MGYFLYISVPVSACDYSDSGKNYPNSEMYNFSSPNVVKLPQELDEISGIAYYAKDTSLFAIIDEGGDIYKFPLKDPKKLRKWKIDKKRDFEDIVLQDSTFYLLVSDGDIEQTTFKNNQFVNEQFKIGKCFNRKMSLNLVSARPIPLPGHHVQGLRGGFQKDP